MGHPKVATDEADAGIRVPASVRQSQMLDSVARNGFVTVSEAARRLGVSEMTVRRDLLALEAKGLVNRTHGGAVRREVFDAEEPIFDRRKRANASAKAAIAAAAAALVGPRETIGLDVGTTALALAEELARRADLRLFTNNLHAAIRLSAGRSPVYIPGGQVRDPELSVIGAPAVLQLRSYLLDRVFIGVSGLIESGFYDYSPEDTEVKRAFIEQAGQVIVLCDSSKFEHRSLALVCSLTEVDVMVTDAAPPPHIAEALETAKVEVLIAAGSESAN